ncbi:hypothetical protein A5780_00215 [Nocardia sp. 852002-20019_SCH5090214]|nr:hypothetical protein A5780_00215 [Nocardia sp. 852002-20019_SCH5090214]
MSGSEISARRIVIVRIRSRCVRLGLIGATDVVVGVELLGEPPPQRGRGLLIRQRPVHRGVECLVDV